MLQQIEHVVSMTDFVCSTKVDWTTRFADGTLLGDVNLRERNGETSGADLRLRLQLEDWLPVRVFGQKGKYLLLDLPPENFDEEWSLKIFDNKAI